MGSDEGLHWESLKPVPLIERLTNECLTVNCEKSNRGIQFYFAVLLLNFIRESFSGFSARAILLLRLYKLASEVAKDLLISSNIPDIYSRHI